MANDPDVIKSGLIERSDAEKAAAEYLRERYISRGLPREAGVLIPEAGVLKIDESGVVVFSDPRDGRYGFGGLTFGDHHGVSLSDAMRRLRFRGFVVEGMVHTHHYEGTGLSRDDFKYGARDSADGGAYTMVVVDLLGNIHRQSFRGAVPVGAPPPLPPSLDDPETGPRPGPRGALVPLPLPTPQNPGPKRGGGGSSKGRPPESSGGRGSASGGTTTRDADRGRTEPKPAKKKKGGDADADGSASAVSVGETGMWMLENGKYVWKGSGPPSSPKPPDPPPQTPPTKQHENEPNDSGGSKDGGNGPADESSSGDGNGAPDDSGDAGGYVDPNDTTGTGHGGGDESRRFHSNYLPMETRALLGFAELARAHAPERPVPPGGGPTDRGGWKPVRARGAAATHPPEGPPGGNRLRNALVDDAASRLMGGARIPRMGTDGPGEVPLNAAALAKAARPILRTVGDEEEAAAKASRDEVRQLLYSEHVAPIIRTAYGARAFARRDGK